MAFRLGVRTKPLNKSGANLRPAGADVQEGTKEAGAPQHKRKAPVQASKGPARRRGTPPPPPGTPASPAENALLAKLGM